MAHHIAELIVAARTAPSEQEQSAREQCAVAIMELWAHRSCLSLNIRPFSDFEAVFRVLASLDPENEGFRYFRSTDWEAALPKDSVAGKKWLETICNIDRAARALTRYCLASAARDAAEKAAEWVKLAEALDAADPDVPIVRFIIDDAHEIHNANPNEQEIQRLELIRTQLEAFNTTAQALHADIERKLKALGPSSDETA